MIKHINERIAKISPILCAYDTEAFKGEDAVYKIGIKGGDYLAAITECTDGFLVEDCDPLNREWFYLNFVDTLNDAIAEAADHCLTINSELEAE